jgi:hypothetical protein
VLWSWPPHFGMGLLVLCLSLQPLLVPRPFYVKMSDHENETFDSANAGAPSTDGGASTRRMGPAAPAAPVLVQQAHGWLHWGLSMGR